MTVKYALRMLLPIFLAGWSAPAMAYIGPGIGIGTLSAILGLITTFFLAIFAVLYYPIKRMMRRRKATAEKSPEAEAEVD